MSCRSCPPAHGWCHIGDEPIVLRSSSPVCCRAKLIRRRCRLFFFLTHSHLDLQGRVFTAESGGESGTVEAASPRDAHTRVISGPSPDQAPRFCTRPPPALATDSSLASYFQGCLENRQSSQCVQAACIRRPWGGGRIRGAIEKEGKEQRFVQRQAE